MQTNAKIKYNIRLTAPTSLLSSPIANATVATTFIKKIARYELD